MGIDLTLDDQVYGGGITYTDMEALEINLGHGNDTFDVQSIHHREDYRTVTVVNSGENTAGGNDWVTVALDREAGGLFALNTQGGDDIVDAGDSTLPLVIFGGDGNDVIIGGSGDDLLFGDSGRVDYRDSLGAIVTRLGAGSGDFIGTVASVDGLTLDREIEAQSSAATDFPTAYGGLAGLQLWVSATGENDKVVSQTRIIAANDAGRVTVSEAFTIDIDENSRFRITGIPENQTDGALREPSQAITWDFSTGGDDVVIAMGDRDIIFGGAGNDTLMAQQFEPPVGLLQQDDGITDFIAAVTALVENRDASMTDDFNLGDVILGDQGHVIFTEPQGSGVAELAPYPLIDQVETIEPQSGGNDRIFASNGPDLVMGGSGADDIDAGAHIPIVYGSRKVISINFNGGAAGGQVTGAAGAVHAGNWNNLAAGGWAYGDDSGEIIRFQDGTAAEGVIVQVAGNLDSAYPVGVGADSHDEIVNPGTQNESLFEGALYTSIYYTLGVNVSGLSEHFDTYDVYVYLDADDAHSLSENSIRSVSDQTTTYYLNDADGNTFRGEFVLADAARPQDARSGNYVVFRNLTTDVATIRIDDVGGNSASGNFPSIAGMQIVAGLDEDDVTIASDTDKDAVIGDGGFARLQEGLIHELVSTDGETFDGDDTIRTGDHTDLVIGGFGSDTIYGEAGHDLLLADKAGLLLFEGRVIGLDLRSFSHAADPYAIEGIQLMADSSGGDDSLAGGMGDDLLYGQFGDDTFVFAGADLGKDHLVEAGNGDAGGRFNDLHDRLDFSGFVERIVVDLRRDDLQAIKPAMDTDTVHLHLLLHCGSAFEDVIGSQFADIIIGNARDNMLSGLGGNDLIYALEGDDLVYGGGGNDIVPDSAGNDEIHGEAGDDYLRGRDGNDRIYGGPGADRLEGGSGDDIIVGGEGDDIIITGEGDDQIVWNEGDGDDTVVDSGGAAAAASANLLNAPAAAASLYAVVEDASDVAGLAGQGGTADETAAVSTANSFIVEEITGSTDEDGDQLSPNVMIMPRDSLSGMLLFGDAFPLGAADSGEMQSPTQTDAPGGDLYPTDDAALSARLANESKSSWMHPFLLNSAREEEEDPNSDIQIILEEESNE
jgi:Ca2+-binding RTX toxin-like protein